MVGWEILSLIDNVFDLLLPSTNVAQRRAPGGPEGRRAPAVEAPLLESGRAEDTPVAEHGLAFLVSVTSGQSRRTLLFDTGSHTSLAIGTNISATLRAVIWKILSNI